LKTGIVSAATLILTRSWASDAGGTVDATTSASPAIATASVRDRTFMRASP
jgi:hypothetical protein